MISSLLKKEVALTSNVLEDNRTSNINIGMITGNPKIAISVALLSAFEEIADINVNVIENPKLAKNRIRKKKGTF